MAERVLKRRKVHSGFSESSNMCCSCLEEDLPYLLYTGCSNGHVMCHVCSRMFLSVRIVLNTFPSSFPGKINSRQSMNCPLCNETLNGISNIFVFNSETKDDEYECPYNTLLNKDDAELLNCNEKYTISNLQNHLIKHHNETIKCPNCSKWLSDPDQNIEEILLFHILKHCKQISCNGCDRKSSMINMYLHSLIGREKICDSARNLFKSFGKNLSEYFYLFEGFENLISISSMMLKWITKYIYIRHKQEISSNINVHSDSFNRLFDRTFYIFVFHLFSFFHKDLEIEPEDKKSTSLEKILKLLKENNEEEYEEFILIKISSFAHKNKKRLDQISELPFVYRILMMILSDFAETKQIYQKYPKKISDEVTHNVEILLKIYEKMSSSKTDQFQELQMQFFENEISR
jgi:hypothetical protein